MSKIFILSQADMYPTLSQYIDPEHIPIKYGGKLDFEFGKMPVLEPALANALTWENPDKQDGKNIWPIGPIKWEESADGTMTAIAVGSENGVPRHRVICRLKPTANSKPTVNAPVPDADLSLTTVGTATQPPDPSEAELYVGADAASSSSSSEASNERSTTTLPIRAGTSASKFAQQDPTHASGQLAEGTPDAAATVHGSGDKTYSMEPNTVGQAPKDMPLPAHPTHDAQQPGYLEQAKEVVEKVVESVEGAVEGLVGGKTEEPHTEPVRERSEAERAMDRKIDSEKPAVEDFLRGQYKSA